MDFEHHAGRPSRVGLLIAVITTVLCAACADNELAGNSTSGRRGDEGKLRDGQPGIQDSSVDGNTGGDREPPRDEPKPPEISQPDSDGSCAVTGRQHLKPRHITGGAADLVLQDNGPNAVKVTGNDSNVSILIPADTQIPALCLFVTGNQSQVTIRIESGGGLATLIYKGRGNQSHARVEVAENAALTNVVADLAGNNAVLELAGAGESPCPDEPGIICL